MARGDVAVAIGGGALDRDAFLARALDAGAREALWFDPALGWAERYAAPTRAAGGSRWGRRELLWPGDARSLPARGAA